MKKEDYIKDIIETLRYRQRRWSEQPLDQILDGEREVSGVQILMEYVQEGVLDMKKALQILPAIENYQFKYEIKDISDE